MATKTISLPADVYRRLAEEKREGESVGDVIDHLLGARPLADVRGAWSEETADSVRAATRDGRGRTDGNRPR